MFTPKWKKDAALLAKAARKFVHYKRDLLPAERIDEIESRRADLLNAVKGGDSAKVAEASKLLRVKCEGALPRYQAPGWFEENVEVMFVAIVIALGLRAYFLQPFRIPTGSMQPTLNGIIGTPMAAKDWPALPKRAVESVLRGRSYVKVVTERDEQLLIGRDPEGNLRTDINDIQFLHFFSRSMLRFADGSTLRLPAPSSQIYETGLSQVLETALRSGGRIPAGTVLCEGIIDAGDLVLVDKVSYHFRKPRRGEVFVFDTRGIEGTRKTSKPKRGQENANKGEADQENATHYIKRLCGVPGDTLQIQPPYLLVDGKIAKEPGIEHVYTLPLSGQLPNQVPSLGYTFAREGYRDAILTGETKSLTLEKDEKKVGVGMREYAALGDNSGNSLDSRYWGTVKEFNVSGPALFTLWPITSGHWGLIK